MKKRAITPKWVMGFTSKLWGRQILTCYKCLQFKFNLYLLQFLNSMPTGFFHLGVHVPFYLHFWGYIQIFRGAISNSSFGGTQKINCIFSTQGLAPCCFFVNITQLAKTFFICLTLGQTGSGVLSDPWPLCLSHHFLCNIVYKLSKILFFIQN